MTKKDGKSNQFRNIFKISFCLTAVGCVISAVLIVTRTWSKNKEAFVTRRSTINSVANDLRDDAVQSGDIELTSGSLFEGSTVGSPENEFSGEFTNNAEEIFSKKNMKKTSYTNKTLRRAVSESKNNGLFFLDIPFKNNKLTTSPVLKSFPHSENNSIINDKNNQRIGTSTFGSLYTNSSSNHINKEVKRNEKLPQEVSLKSRHEIDEKQKVSFESNFENVMSKNMKNFSIKTLTSKDEFGNENFKKSSYHGATENYHVRDGGYLPPTKHDESTPVFEENYHASGVLILPHSNIAEPFEIWYAPSKKKSRIDYYYGTDKTFQRGDLGDHGVAYKYVPMYTDGKGSFDGCWLLTGTTNQPVIPQIITPNMTWFTYNSTTVYTGTLATKWTYEYFAFGMRNHQTVWITEAKPHRPIRYEMIGYDMMLGSYYDHYVINYITFEKWDGKDEIFNLPTYTSCYNWSRSLESSLLSNPMQEFAVFTPEKAINIEERYNAYKAEHNKANSSTLDERKRTHIFKHNARFIDSHNRKNASYRLKPNHFLDMSLEEINMHHGSLGRDTKKHKGIVNIADISEGKSNIHKNADISGDGKLHTLHVNEDEIPEEIDWREFGAVTSVKGQGICSGCYAFTAAGAAEGGWFRKTGKLVEVSPQQLVDCSWGYGNHGCKGGHYASALSWVFTHGISTDKSYGKYLGQEGYCHFNDTLFGAQIDGFSYIQPYNISALKRVVAKHGPVAVSINTKPLSFKFYSKGIYNDKDCLSNQTHHSALIVGYGKAKDQEYWIVKNSWSSSWGEGGYMKLAMENHLCGVTENPIAVVVKNPQFQIPMKAKLTKEDFFQIISDRKKAKEGSETNENQQNKNEVIQEKASPIENPKMEFLNPSPVASNTNQNIDKTQFVSNPNHLQAHESSLQSMVSTQPQGYIQVKIPFLESNTNATKGSDPEKNMIDQVFQSMSSYKYLSEKNKRKKRNHAHKIDDYTHSSNSVNHPHKVEDRTHGSSSKNEVIKVASSPLTKHETNYFIESQDLINSSDKKKNDTNSITAEKLTVNNRSSPFSTSFPISNNPINPVNKSDPNYVNFYPFLGLHIEDFDKTSSNDENNEDEANSSKVKPNHPHPRKGAESNKLTNKIFLSNDLKQMQKTVEEESKETNTKELANVTDQKLEEPDADVNDRINSEQDTNIKTDINALQSKGKKTYQTITDTGSLKNGVIHLKDFPSVHRLLKKEIAKQQILKNKERIHSMLHQNLKENFAFLPELTAAKKITNSNSLEQGDLRLDQGDNQETSGKASKFKDVLSSKLTENNSMFEDKTTFSSNDLKETPVLNPEEKVSFDEKPAAINDSDERIKPSLNPEEIGTLNPEKIGNFQNQPNDNDSKPTVTGTKKSIINVAKENIKQSMIRSINLNDIQFSKSLKSLVGDQKAKHLSKSKTVYQHNGDHRNKETHKSNNFMVSHRQIFSSSKSLKKSPKEKKKRKTLLKNSQKDNKKKTKRKESVERTQKKDSIKNTNKKRSIRKLTKFEKVIKESMDNLYSRIDKAVTLKHARDHHSLD